MSFQSVRTSLIVIVFMTTPLYSTPNLVLRLPNILVEHFDISVDIANAALTRAMAADDLHSCLSLIREGESQCCC